MRGGVARLSRLPRHGRHGRCYLHRCRSVADPRATVVEALDFETIFSQAVATMLTLMPDYVPRDSDPVTKQLQVFAYRELLLRQRMR